MKIPIENIYYLLCYSWNKLEEKEQVSVNAQDFTELIDLFAVVLKNGINQLIKRGFDRNYIEFSEDTKRLRGKIDFGVSLKKNLLKKAQMHCHFDDLNHNILHNRIIKSTIQNLINTEKIDKEIRSELRDVYLKLPGIDLIKIENKHFRMIQLNSNNNFYDFLLNVCELIHNNLFIDEKSGKYNFKDFTRDEKKMASLFEDFLRNFYRIELVKYVTKSLVKRDKFGWYYEGNEKMDDELFSMMETDISITLPLKKIIIEVKYYSEILVEHFGKDKLRSDHIKQIFAYLKNIEQRGGLNIDAEGILLYPFSNENINTQKKLHGGHTLKIRTINLNQNWKLIHDDLINMVIN